MNEFIRKIKKEEKGSMMIEAVVGLTLVTVGLLGIFNLVTNSIRTNRAAGYRFIASNLAAEGVEITKSIIDTNIAQGRPWNQYLSEDNYEFSYDSFMDNDTNYNDLWLGLSEPEYLKLDGDRYQYNSGDETIFKRKISIDNESEDIIRVNSIVSWEENGEVKKINVEDHFYNWRGVK
ncbi:MAG TPA: hypothetical protein VKO61_01735 [Candidatus Paceibacterota bacterium]|nr:hypothetical protein [Candidatus Paceibacterota bacterium]